MAWVRYDDNFYAHEKVGRLLILGPIGVEALGLHVLANTWSASTKRPGFIPAHQPGVLMANTKRGAKLAQHLEDADLWDKVDGGWEFHDAADYRASPKRQTPGTPADLSAKRARAGSKGGSKTAASRAAKAANGQASVEQTSSKPCSPVVASNEATPEPEPVPTTSGVVALRDTDDDPNLGQVVAAYVNGAVEAGLPRPSERFRGKVGRDARRLSEKDHVPIAALVVAARSMGARGWDDLDREVQRVGAAGGRASPADDRMSGHLALINKLTAEEKS